MYLYDIKPIECEGLHFKAEVHDDEFGGTPWENDDSHGPVSEWTTRDKRPGERVLNSDRSSKRYYDFEEACKIALRDGWGVEDPTGKSKAQIASEAAEKDFEHLRGWCNDEWHYVGVLVYLLDVNGRKTDESESLWGIESDEDDYIVEVARELAAQVAHKIGAATQLCTRIR